MSTITELKRSIGIALGIIAPEADEVKPAKVKPTVQPNRSALRAMRSRFMPMSPNEFQPGTVAHVMAGKHVRSRRTGQPHHFQVWMHEANLVRQLKKIRTANLAQKPGLDPKLAAALNLVSAFAPTVYDLSTGRKPTVPGVGTVALRRIKTYLEENNVKVEWAA